MGVDDGVGVLVRVDVAEGVTVGVTAEHGVEDEVAVADDVLSRQVTEVVKITGRSSLPATIESAANVSGAYVPRSTKAVP